MVGDILSCKEPNKRLVKAEERCNPRVVVPNDWALSGQTAKREPRSAGACDTGPKIELTSKRPISIYVYWNIIERYQWTTDVTYVYYVILVIFYVYLNVFANKRWQQISIFVETKLPLLLVKQGKKWFNATPLNLFPTKILKRETVLTVSESPSRNNLVFV